MDEDGVTPSEAGLTQQQQFVIILRAIEEAGGEATIQDCYAAIKPHLNGKSLSRQGHDSLRRIVNTNAVEAGFIEPHDPNKPGWRITPRGRLFLVTRQQDFSAEPHTIEGDTDSLALVKTELDDLVAQAQEQIDAAMSESAVEGAPVTRLVNTYERNPNLRAAAIKIHGTTCQACGFSFDVYGPQGAGFIEVHHLKPLAQQKSEAEVNPRTDMAILCANCHRMIHRHPNSPLTIDQLRTLLRRNEG